MAEMLYTSQEASQSTIACTHATSHMFASLRPTVRRYDFKIGKALSHTHTHTHTHTPRHRARTHAHKNSEYAIVEATGLADLVLHPPFFSPSSPYPIHPKKAVNYAKPTKNTYKRILESLESFMFENLTRAHTHTHHLLQSFPGPE